MTDILQLTVPGPIRYRMYNPGGRIGKRMSSGKPYEHKLLHQIRGRNLKGSALDLGAHVGNHSIYLALVCGLKVHAWEADAGRREQLAANLRLNEKISKRVTVYPYAAGAGTGFGSWKGGRYMSLDVGDGPVPIRAVDEVMDVPDLSLVKIDIEGMEPDALRGMREHLKRSHPVVYTEVHTDEAHRAQAAVLKPLGYQMTSPVVMGSRMECWVWRS